MLRLDTEVLLAVMYVCMYICMNIFVDVLKYVCIYNANSNLKTHNPSTILTQPNNHANLVNQHIQTPAFNDCIQVFQDCIKGVLASKTRLLVTHQLGILPEVDRIVLMDKAFDGTFY